MQKIERYGVIALVVLLVTILAVSLWGESKGSWQFWKKDTKKPEAASTDRLGRRANGAQTPAGPTAQLDKNGLPLSQPIQSPLGSTPAQTPLQSQVDPALANAPANPTLGANTPPANPMPTPLGLQTGSGANPQTTPPAEGNPLALNSPIKPVDPALQPVQRGLDLQGKPKDPMQTAATRAYTVKAGDTLGEIASRELGSSARWSEIQLLNGNLDPKKLRAGMTLQLPAGRSVAANNTPGKNPAEKPATKPAGGRAYVVKSGDSLSKIASRELGDGERWTEIRDLNPQVDPKSLKVGASLTLPAGTAVRKETTSVAKAGDGEVVGWGPRTSGKKSRVQ